MWLPEYFMETIVDEDDNDDEDNRVDNAIRALEDALSEEI